MPIYCDEAGYTGPDLLDDNQPYFVYASLHIAEQEASEFVKHIKKKYHLQGELKGKNLVAGTRGRKAIRELYEKYAKEVKIVYHDKKYALACKYYEYVFEPVVAESSSFFYKTKFHQFISHILFAIFRSDDARAETIFQHFQALVRGKNQTALFTPNPDITKNNQLLQLIIEFTLLHKEEIFEEIYTDDELDYWILDLTHNSLNNLLCLWSEKIGELEVVCDDSKPLAKAINIKPLFSELHKEIVYYDGFGTGNIPITFNLSTPIKIESSHGSAGLQLTDLFASSFYYMLNNPEDELSIFIRSYYLTVINLSNSFCVVPEPEKFIQPHSREFTSNLFTLSELVRFSKISPADTSRLFLENTRKQLAKGLRVKKKDKINTKKY